MTDQRLDALSGDLYNHVVAWLAKNDIPNDDSVDIAGRVEAAFRKACGCDEIMHCPVCECEVDEPGECPDCCEWAMDDGQPTEMDEWHDFDPDC